MEMFINWIWDGVKGKLFEVFTLCIALLISTLFWNNHNLIVLRFFIVISVLFVFLTVHYCVENRKSKKLLQNFQNPTKTDIELLEDKVLLFIEEEINTKGTFKTDDIDKITGKKSFSIEILKNLYNKDLINYKDIKIACDGDYMLVASDDDLFTLNGLTYVKTLK